MRPSGKGSDFSLTIANVNGFNFLISGPKKTGYDGRSRFFLDATQMM